MADHRNSTTTHPSENYRNLNELVDFNEKTFNIDEYEQRLSKFEFYLKKQQTHQIALDRRSSSRRSEGHINHASRQNLNPDQDPQLLRAISDRQVTQHLAGEVPFGLPGFADLGEALKSYFEKFRCFDKRSKHNLFGIKSILNKWKASERIDQNEQPEEYKVSSLVNVNKTLNYLNKRKREFEERQQTCEMQLKELVEKKAQFQIQQKQRLTKMLDSCEYDDPDELESDMTGMMQSQDYLMNPTPSNFLYNEVATLESQLPRLRELKTVEKELKNKTVDLQQAQSFLKDTLQDIQRLNLREQYLLKRAD